MIFIALGCESQTATHGVSQGMSRAVVFSTFLHKK